MFIVDRGVSMPKVRTFFRCLRQQPRDPNQNFRANSQMSVMSTPDVACNNESQFYEASQGVLNQIFIIADIFTLQYQSYDMYHQQRVPVLRGESKGPKSDFYYYRYLYWCHKSFHIFIIVDIFTLQYQSYHTYQQRVPVLRGESYLFMFYFFVLWGESKSLKSDFT